MEQLQAVRVGQERAEADIEARAPVQRVRRRRPGRHHRGRPRYALPHGAHGRIQRRTGLDRRALPYQRNRKSFICALCIFSPLLVSPNFPR